MTASVSIKKREEKRVLRGHLWVFSNEVQRVDGSPQPGEIVRLLRHDGDFLGLATYHPNSLIACRLLSRADVPIDESFFRERVGRALALRRDIYPDEEAFRVVHGESDGLPGLVVDLYGRTVVVQTFSTGMDIRLGLITGVLLELLKPDAILARNDSPLRTLEGLPLETRVLHGTPAETTIREHGISYVVDPVHGQKTGMFLDQKDNRLAIRRYVRGRRVLDCFANSGGFAMNAAVAGAAAVSTLDSSDQAVEAIRKHFDLNGLSCAEFLIGDAFDILEAKRREGAMYDGIILDPPAFTRNKRTVATALKAYRRLNMLAMEALSTDGILISASCSHHIGKQPFLEMLEASAYRAGRTIRILEYRGASADHPVSVAMPETEYLKLAICSVV